MNTQNYGLFVIRPSSIHHSQVIALEAYDFVYFLNEILVAVDGTNCSVHIFFPFFSALSILDRSPYLQRTDRHGRNCVSE